MKMKFLIILFLFFLPIVSVKAQVCTCYNAAGVCQTNKTTTGSGIDDPPDAVSCDDYCVSQLRGDFSYYKFSDYGGESIPNEVSTQISCETNAEAAAANATPSTQTAPTVKREYVSPVLSVNIPTISFSKIAEDNGYIEVNWLSEYVTGLYKYLLTISGIFAVLLLMVGGLQYVVSAGGSGTASAKKRMTNALTGMVLLFCVYMILFIVNPKLTVFDTLSIKQVPEIPFESASVTFNSGIDAGTGNFYGASKSQDCFLKKYGDSKTAVEANLVDVSYKNRTYRVNTLVAEDFKKALEAVDASGVNYDITTSLSGNTYSWRANVNSPEYLSPHAFGIALDINPEKNPNCPKTCTTGGACLCIGGSDCETLCRARTYDLPKEVISAFTSNGFAWGGNWRKVKDYMHFHYIKDCNL